MSTVRISEEHKELVEDVADQLDTTIKEVLEGIIDWFFSVSAELYEDDSDDEDDEDEEE